MGGMPFFSREGERRVRWMKKGVGKLREGYREVHRAAGRRGDVQVVNKGNIEMSGTGKGGNKLGANVKMQPEIMNKCS